MASQIKVDEIAGAAGTTVTIPVGQTLDVLGTLDIDGGTLVLPANVVTTDGTQTLTNKTINASQLVDGSVATGKVADDAITLAKMASGTDGNIISYDIIKIINYLSYNIRDHLIDKINLLRMTTRYAK